jgi:hypothetical protein
MKVRVRVRFIAKNKGESSSAASTTAKFRR